MAWDGFDPVTKDVKSRALPEIYSDPAKFKAAQDTMFAEMTKFRRPSRPATRPTRRPPSWISTRPATVATTRSGRSRSSARADSPATGRRAAGRAWARCSPSLCAPASATPPPPGTRSRAIPRHGRRLRRLPHRGPEGRRAFAGGRALKTPFGTFYGPNLTPHPQAGIGRWTEADFVRAMRQGLRPDGAHYYPAFPYPSFTRISDADLRTCGRICARCRRAPAEPGARAAFSVPLALRHRRLEVAVLHPGSVRERSPTPAGGRPRRLPRRGARPLRRMPHAAQFPRRRTEGSRASPAARAPPARTCPT